jgi:hypothetical protein
VGGHQQLSPSRDVMSHKFIFDLSYPYYVPALPYETLEVHLLVSERVFALGL